jgi:hypothetical protein
MAVTPITAPFVLQISYKSLVLTHKVNLFCDGGLNGGTGNYEVKGKQTANWITPGTAAAAFVLLAKPLLKTTGSFTTWTLFENSDGMRIPRNSGSLGTAGTSAGSEAEWSQSTFYFRDTEYKPVKLVLMGLAGGGIYRSFYSALPASFQALIADMYDTTAGHLGEWVTSRGFSSLSSFLALTYSANRKSRRRLGTE